MAIEKAELDKAYWDFCKFMKSGYWDKIGPEGIYEDDAHVAICAFIEFILTGKVTTWEEELNRLATEDRFWDKVIDVAIAERELLDFEGLGD